MGEASLEGKKIRNHLIQSLIGEGGMAVVYKVTEQSRGQVKAIKFMRKVHQEESKRFLQEADIGKRLSHPNIVQTFEVGKLKGHPAFSYFMIMEYINGKSLKQVSHLSCLRILEICMEICNGLSVIHDAHVVHRDLKPSNILITQDGAVKISDLGVVKFNEETQFTKTGTVLGTPAYMSPEQCRDSSRVDSRSDIYSLGIMMYEMFANRLPFKGPSDYNFIVQHSFEPPPSLFEYAPGLPPQIYEMVAKMLEKDPAQRYQTLAEFFPLLKQVYSQILVPTPEKSQVHEDEIVLKPLTPLQPKQQRKSIFARIFSFHRRKNSSRQGPCQTKEHRTKTELELPAPRKISRSKKIPKPAYQKAHESKIVAGSFQDQLRSISGKTKPLPKLSGRHRRSVSKRRPKEEIIAETRVVIGKTTPLPRLSGRRKKDEGEEIIAKKKIIIGDTAPLSKVSGRHKKATDKKKKTKRLRPQR